ncbi:MAG: PAS domain S-box protein [Spirochaetales bacterium]|uniref:PAS domain S-box protein n=1 Tax=Candidatus Thalassospirochaeta sargassi TaxID=3119039 RepID=A0AAJ1II84_9SPIO|nr:PAS domain S-box protein [Spirochaetales bacterium]
MSIDFQKNDIPSELYKLMVDQFPFQVTFFDLDFKVLYANSFSCNFFGLSNEEMTEKHLFEYMLPEEAKKLELLLKTIDINNPVVSITNQNFNADGESRWNLWYDRGLFDDSGKLFGYQSIGQDVTEKTEIEANLALNRERLKEAQRIGNMGDWEWDITTGLSYWSEETYRLLGFSPNEVEPDQDFYRSLIPGEFLKNFQNEQQTAFKNQESEFNYEYPVIIKDSSKKWLRDKARIEYKNGKPARIIGTILDITESKQLQHSLESYIALEETLLEISNTFMLSEKEKTGAAINKTLRILGSKFDADRCYLILDDSFGSQKYHWYSSDYNHISKEWAASEIATPSVIYALQNNPGFLFSASEPDKNLSKKDLSWFRMNRIGSFAAVSLHHNNENCGYLCMDSRLERLDWNDIDFSFLNIAGEMCVNARASIRTRQEIEREKELLSTTLMSITDGFILLTPEGKIDMLNNSALSLLGRKSEILHNRLFEEVIKIKEPNNKHGIGFKELRTDVMDSGSQREAMYSHPDGSERILSYSCSLIPDIRNEGEGLALIFRDITEEKKKQDEVAFLSFHDSLTGLYNRAFMDAELRRLDTARQLPLSIIIGDVNGLKLVNDVFGHEDGDQLLKTIGEIITNCCRDEDVISRWGGDEFSIILPATNQKTADKICERIKKQCEQPNDTQIIPSIALGAASKTNIDENLSEIMREAEDRMYRQKLLDDRSVRSDIISSLKNSMFEKSFETEEHTKRMLKITENFGKFLKLPSNKQSDLNLLAIMHDMGKIAIPSRILGKTEKLNAEDWEEIKRHPEAGYRIAQSSQELSSIADEILSHHERWDGNGYPRGLKGKEIPELSRIISIVDTYDVMTSGRVYKEGVSHTDALKEIGDCAGGQFDPEYAEKFIDMMNIEDF